MRIAATILSGNSESLIGEAIVSARDWVDTILLIDTGIADGTLEIAQTLGGEKLHVEKLAWCDDFAAARNFALQRAAAAGASWALTVDTDERLSFPGMESIEGLRSTLNATPGVLVWLVPSRDGSYAKERFIRVPTQLTWQGRVHEALVGASANQRRILTGVNFFEIPKTREQHLAKVHRDLEVLKAETQEKPGNARWWYYLGQTWEELGETRQAIDAYRHCYELRQWAEQGAWACYRAATCHLKLSEFDRALDVCSLGLARQAESPELAWLAGLCRFRLGRLHDAVAWEQIAIGMGHFEGLGMGQQRISFRYLPGWYEGPYDVLRFAWRQLAQSERATECEEKHRAAQSMRTQRGTGASFTRTEPERPSIRNSVLSDSLLVPGAGGGSVGAAPDAVPGQRRSTIRVAVLGLYSSGSAAIAEVLHHLGVHLGQSFRETYFEPRWLAEQLRRWWREPELCEAAGKEERVRLLARWVRDMEGHRPGAVGAKHPLLCLCGADLLDAWGPDTKFIWSYRPLEDSIGSLERRGWWPGRERKMQECLWTAVTAFLSDRSHLKVDFRDVVTCPEREVERIIEYLGIDADQDRVSAAVGCIQRRGPKPGGLVREDSDARPVIAREPQRASVDSTPSLKQVRKIPGSDTIFNEAHAPSLRGFFLAGSREEICPIFWKEYRHPIFMRRGTSDFFNFRQIFVGKGYDADLGDGIETIIDLGSYIGLSAVFFAGKYPRARIVCVEPSDENFEILKLNVRPYSNITCTKSGVWSHKTFLCRDERHIGADWGAVFNEATEGPSRVPALSIGDIVSEFGIEKIDFLKIDIEGSERVVFSENFDSWLPRVNAVACELHDSIVPGCSEAYYKLFRNEAFTELRHGESVWFFRNGTKRGNGTQSVGAPASTG